jgi:hypothetical protein
MAPDLNRPLALADPGGGDRGIVKEQCPPGRIARRRGDDGSGEALRERPAALLGRAIALAIAPPGELAGRLRQRSWCRRKPRGVTGEYVCEIASGTKTTS